MPRAVAIALAVACVTTLAVAPTAAGAMQPKRGEARSAKGALEARASLAPMLKRVLPGVVSVLVEGARERPRTVSANGVVEETAMREPFRAGGSGVVVDAANGYVLTNNHVIAAATAIQVVLADGRSAKADLIGTDVATDVAVLRVPLRDLTAVPYGNSDALRVGDFVAAVGAPYGLEGSASQGIVSALARSDIGYGIFEDFIQTDAAINPGNSGGALVDIEGRLVGLNTASGAQRLRTQGIAFAVPINVARSVGEEIVKSGRFKRGSLGIVTGDIGYDMARDLGLMITRGAEVKTVLAGSPAARAGVTVGDVIVAIDGRAIRSQVDYVARVSTTALGKSVLLRIVRPKAAPREERLTVADFPIPPAPESPPMMTAGSLEGLAFGAVLPGFKGFGLVQGGRVLTVGTGPGARLGLKPDDVVVKVDMTITRSPQDVFDAVGARMGRYRLEVWRDGEHLWIYGDG